MADPSWCAATGLSRLLSYGRSARPRFFKTQRFYRRFAHRGPEANLKEFWGVQMIFALRSLRLCERKKGISRKDAKRYIRGAGRLGILTAIGLGQFPAGSQAPSRPPQNIFGTYGQASAGRDSVQISGKANGRIGVAIRLYFSSGHTCRLNAEGDWRDDHVAVVADGLSPARPCKLNVFFDKGRALLKDEGYQCTPVYCGTRGKLDDVSLPKSTASRR